MSVIIPDRAALVKSIGENSIMFFAMPSSTAGSDNRIAAGSDKRSSIAAGSDKRSSTAAANGPFPASPTILSVVRFRPAPQSYLWSVSGQPHNPSLSLHPMCYPLSSDAETFCQYFLVSFLDAPQGPPFQTRDRCSSVPSGHHRSQ